jgi:hypothetical protein
MSQAGRIEVRRTPGFLRTPGFRRTQTSDHVRGSSAAARSRPRGLAILVLAIAAALAAGCSDDAFYPATLEELPPKEQAATPGQETDSPTPDESPTPTPTPTPTFEGLHVDCVFVDVSVPDTWELQEQADNTWAYSLPTKETGGGVVRISGSFEEGDGAAAQKDLEARVRGEDGDKVAVQVSGDGVVMGWLAVKKGNEWRLAKAFADVGIQVVTVGYAPAGDAGDAKIEDTRSLLQDVASKAALAGAGTCP